MINFITNKIPLSYQQVALLVQIQGNIDKLSQNQLEKQFLDYLQVGFHFIILDCSGLKSINSTGLQILLKTVEMYHADGGVFLFIRVLPQIGKFFDMLGFTPIFTSFTKQEEAVKYLEEQLRKTVESEQKKTVSPAHSLPILPETVSNLPVPSSQQPARPPTTSVDVTKGKIIYGANALRPKTNNTGMSLLLEIQTHHTMQKNNLFAIILTIMSVDGKTDPPILNIVPYFPGCTITPEYRAVYLSSGQQTCFWVSPNIHGDIPAWLELWCGDDNIQQLLLTTRVITQRWPICMMSIGLLSQYVAKILTDKGVWENISIPFWTGYALASIIFLLGAFLYWYRQRIRYKIIQQNFTFED